MKRSFLLLVVLASACLLPDRLEASAFTLNSFSVDLHTSDPGLVLWEKNLLATPDPFNLTTIGQSVTQKLFQIGTNETALNPDDLVPYSIAVSFNFVTPTFQGTTQGITGAGWWGQNFGYVVWNNPLTLAFGQTGLLGITLTDATFGLPGATDVSATFKLLQADTSTLPKPIPEPSSLMLLGVGAVGACFWRRRLA